MVKGIVAQIEGEVAIIDFTVPASSILRKVYIYKDKFKVGQEVTVDVVLIEKAVKPAKIKPTPVVCGVSQKLNRNSRSGVLQIHRNKLSR